MGRSALDFICSIAQNISKERILLIGSKQSHLEVNMKIFEIVQPKVGFELIRENALFFNSAFLRREALQVMTSEEYMIRNEEISDLAVKALEQKNLFSFINLSSGVARDLDEESENKTADDYSRLKKSLEVKYSEIGKQNGVPIVNCRIFSLTGKHLNEYENLALSSFIRQAKFQNRIDVISPSTKRTYVDAVNLAGMLFSIASQGKDASFDSGGILLSMLELAQNVAMVLNKSNLEIVAGQGESPDYFGDYQGFNELASKMNLDINGIQDQILNTLKAFT